MKIDLARAKLHLRVDVEIDDAMITSLIAAAYIAIEGKVFRKIYDSSVPAGDTTGIVADEAINAAALMIVMALYDSPQAPIPEGVDFFITPYILTSAGF